MLLEASHTFNVCNRFAAPKGKTGTLGAGGKAPRVGAVYLTGPLISVIQTARQGQELGMGEGWWMPRLGGLLAACLLLSHVPGSRMLS